MNLCIYGNRGRQHITLTELLAIQRTDGGLFARAEHSSCDGAYVEVARWCEKLQIYARYAFCRMFDGEHDTGQELAELAANAINAADDWPTPIIHSLPNWGEQ